MPTHVMQKLDDNFKEDIVKFLGEVKKKRFEIEVFKQKRDKTLVIGNMDEVPVYFDMARGAKYHFQDHKNIHAIRINGYKKRCTVVLWKEVAPMIIFKASGKTGNKYPGKYLVRSNSKGWINDVIVDWEGLVKI